MVNSVGGGGTLLTFPSLLAAGVLPLTANGTSSFSLVPGALSSYWGYRHEVGDDKRVLWALAIPSLAGGWLGAQLALWSSDALFSALVPWLILVATVLFALQEPIRRRFATGAAEPVLTTGRIVSLVAMQLVVAVYGGYFGAGMGILMLAALGLMGETNLHRMNALKNLAAACINGVGTITFIVGGRVHWPYALLMAAGAILGGYSGAGIARRIGQKNVRRLVIAIGVALTAQMLYRRFA